MPKLYVRIKGTNILRTNAETPSLPPTRQGFLTVRFVEGDDPNEAAVNAVRSIMDRLYQEGLLLNAPSDPPSIEVEEITEIAEFPAIGSLGLIWFPSTP